MADRSRSRSPDRGDQDANPPTDNEQAQPNGGDDSGNGGPPNDNSNGDSGAGGEEVKLYVGNLDYATDEARLREEFSQFGTVTEVFLPTERGTQRPRGFGFVTLSSREAAERAISKMDQAQLDGRTVRVNESRPKGERRGGFGPGGAGGFNAITTQDLMKTKMTTTTTTATTDTQNHHHHDGNNVLPANVLCFGASLTAGTSPPSSETFPYAAYLEETLKKGRLFVNDDVTVVHVGLPGWRADEMLENINGEKGLRTTIQHFQNNPFSIVILLAGTNDLSLYDEKKIANNLISLHKVCYDAGIPHTIAIGIPPSDYQLEVLFAAEEARIINDMLQEFCNTEHKATFMPFPFEYEGGGEYWSPDGLHLSAQGYKKLGESLAPIVEEILLSK